MFAVFLGGALAWLALAQLQTGVDVRNNVGPVGYYLAYPLVWLVGWPAAAMAPLAPAVHALRVFGRLESETDRKWMVFFGGVVVLVPIGVALAMAPELRETNSATGIWGSFVAFYLHEGFGGLGAWLLWVLASSALTAATLAWNPVRAIVGRGGVQLGSATASEAPERKRKGRAEALSSTAASALGLEPPAE